MRKLQKTSIKSLIMGVEDQFKAVWGSAKSEVKSTIRSIGKKKVGDLNQRIVNQVYHELEEVVKQKAFGIKTIDHEILLHIVEVVLENSLKSLVLKTESFKESWLWRIYKNLFEAAVRRFARKENYSLKDEKVQFIARKLTHELKLLLQAELKEVLIDEELTNRTIDSFNELMEKHFKGLERCYNFVFEPHNVLEEYSLELIKPAIRDFFQQQQKKRSNGEVNNFEKALTPFLMAELIQQLATAKPGFLSIEPYLQDALQKVLNSCEVDLEHLDLNMVDQLKSAYQNSINGKNLKILVKEWMEEGLIEFKERLHEPFFKLTYSKFWEVLVENYPHKNSLSCELDSWLELILIQFEEEWQEKGVESFRQINKIIDVHYLFAEPHQILDKYQPLVQYLVKKNELDKENRKELEEWVRGELLIKLQTLAFIYRGENENGTLAVLKTLLDKIIRQDIYDWIKKRRKWKEVERSDLSNSFVYLSETEYLVEKIAFLPFNQIDRAKILLSYWLILTNKPLYLECLVNYFGKDLGRFGVEKTQLFYEALEECFGQKYDKRKDQIYALLASCFGMLTKEVTGSAFQRGINRKKKKIYQTLAAHLKMQNEVELSEAEIEASMEAVFDRIMEEYFLHRFPDWFKN